MSGFSIRDVRRRVVVCVAAAVSVAVVGLAVPACSSVGEGQAADAAILIQTTQLFVTVENKAGAPLLNVTVSVMSVANQAFSHLISRMENGEKRDISLSDFSGRDGTTFSLRVVRPKSVRVTAEDLSNKKHEVEVPWK